MRTLKTILAASILSAAISVPAYAGDMSTPAGPTPPPATCTCDQQPPTTTSTEPVGTGSTDGPYSAPGTVETPEFAVDVLLALLFLF